jgi:hypothetical protein
MTLGNSFLLSRSLDLESVRTEYAAGNQWALALAIHLCGERGLTLPAWVVEAWRQGCHDIVDRKVESWDDVLANSKRKTVKQLLHKRIKDQKKFMILFRAEVFREIPISNNKDKTILVGRRYMPDRFGTIAETLTSDGNVHKIWGKCARSEARTLWYELFPAKAKHKKGSK